MPKETRIHQVFRSRIEYLTQHADVVDAALLVASSRISGSSEKKLAIALGVTAETHPRLAAFPTKQWDVTVYNYSKRLNDEYTLHLLYSYFDEYADSIVEALPHATRHYKNHDSVSATLPVSELLSAPKAVDELIAKALVSTIEAQRSGRKRLESIEEICGLKIDGRAKADALYVLDVRNAIVHDGGVVTSELLAKWGRRVGQELVKLPEEARAGATIAVSSHFKRKAVERLAKYVAAFDAALINAGVLKSRTGDAALPSRHLARK